MEQQIKIYVGCALTCATEEFRQRVVLLKEELRKHGIKVLEFAWTNPTHQAGNVYDYDLGRVEEADILIAVCDLPSIGLGMEIQHAVTLGKQVIACAHHDARVSKIVPNCLESSNQTELLRYNDLLETIPYIVTQCKEIQISRSSYQS